MNEGVRDLVPYPHALRHYIYIGNGYLQMALGGGEFCMLLH